MIGGLRGVGPFAGNDPGRGERGHLQAETDEKLAMVVEVCRVREAVATDVGAVSVLRVGPPVVALGEVVVCATFASCGVDGGYGLWLLLQVPVSSTEDA